MERLPTLGPRGEGWVLLQGILLAIAGVAGAYGLVAPAWHGALRLITSAAGAVLIAAGTWQWWRGARDLGRGLTPFPRPKADAHLVETGVYRHVRHPIYGGVIASTAGWALFTASPVGVVIAAVLVPVFWLKSTVEERWLEQRFPGYPAYRRRTRRFIPRVF